jgi:hypothetical protein
MGRIVLLVAIAGCLGGLLNSLVGGSSLVLPEFATVNGSHVMVPGFAGNVLVGGLAALLSYALYGPIAGYVVVTTGLPGDGSKSAPAQLTAASLAGALLVGFSGGRWITAEANSKLNHGIAVATAEAAERAVSTQVRAVNTTAQRFEQILRSIQAQSPREAYDKASQVREELAKP